jgi:predicted molibdopterin-dependent oxidoreductase YjgC
VTSFSTISPAGRGTGKLSWASAVEEAAVRLRQARERHGPAAVAILASPRMTNEDLHDLSLLASRALPGAPIFLARHERGEDDAILIRRDKSPNSRGAREILGQARPAENLPAEMRSGKVAALLMAGNTMTGTEDDTPLAEEDLRAVEALVLVDSFETAASGAAQVVLPALAFGEHEGTFTNFTGQVQRVRAALPPQADAWPAWKIFQEIGAKLAGTEMPRFTGAQAVFKSLAGSAPPYAGLSYARLGEQGAPLGSGTP